MPTKLISLSFLNRTASYHIDLPQNILTKSPVFSYLKYLFIKSFIYMSPQYHISCKTGIKDSPALKDSILLLEKFKDILFL